MRNGGASNSSCFNAAGLINITSGTDVVSLKYVSLTKNAAQDRFYSWQLLKLK